MTVQKRPKPITGRSRPDPYDLDAQARAERAQLIVEGIWVDTERQRTILNSIRKYMRVCEAMRTRRGSPISGRRLSQFSQAGKSAIAERLIRELELESIEAGEVPNPYRVIHVTIDQRMTLKMLYQEILNRLADDFVDEPHGDGIRSASKRAAEIKGNRGDNIKILEQRVEEWVEKLGVELIVVDEIQRLVTNAGIVHRNSNDIRTFLTADAMDVTKKLQAFLDRGVVPLFFIGDETSKEFFEINQQFAARLNTPLELRPLNVKKTPDRKRFLDFCVDFDRQIVAQNITALPTCLTEPNVLTALVAASGGHIGRAARIIQVALPAALERGAVTMEAFDLSNAVRDFAIGLRWIDYDPFSLQPDLVDGTNDAETADVG
jgi:hypothetical protein